MSPSRDDTADQSTCMESARLEILRERLRSRAQEERLQALDPNAFPDREALFRTTATARDIARMEMLRTRPTTFLGPSRVLDDRLQEFDTSDFLRRGALYGASAQFSASTPYNTTHYHRLSSPGNAALPQQ